MTVTSHPTTASWQPYAEYVDGEEHTVTGNVQVLKDFWSPQLHNRRDLFVYLPPSYGNGQRYPVLYMHDGQNLFDGPRSYAGEWQADETMEMLSEEGIEAIIVGVANAGVRRLDEYGPFRDPRGSGGHGSEYVTFLAETVKPLIDTDFATLPDREHTGVMGSSMGGLISMYAFFRRPDIFGFAGVVSPSIWFAGRTILSYVRAASFAPGKIYLDVGTEEGPPIKLDPKATGVFKRRYAADVQTLAEMLEQKGYLPGRDLRYIEEEGGIHNEADWARRLPDALRFLLS
jgi:predicted alpha/beta superfamily hydrolase